MKIILILVLLIMIQEVIPKQQLLAQKKDSLTPVILSNKQDKYPKENFAKNDLAMFK